MVVRAQLLKQLPWVPLASDHYLLDPRDDHWAALFMIVSLNKGHCWETNHHQNCVVKTGCAEGLVRPGEPQ